MKLNKIVLTTLFPLYFFGCMTSPTKTDNHYKEDNSAAMTELGIPEEFHDYREKMTDLKSGIISVGNYNYHLFFYNINNSPEPEVVEVRQIFGVSSEGLKVSREPIAYVFDINHNGEIEENEILLDLERDGFGPQRNERWFNDSKNQGGIRFQNYRHKDSIANLPYIFPSKSKNALA